MCYSPLREIKNKYIQIYKNKLFESIQSDEKTSYSFSRLQVRFPRWYRGCTWFFFTEEILGFYKNQNYDDLDI